MFWGRAMGWYAMALVDVLDYLPKDHPKRGELIAILNREMTALEKVQDKRTGLWWLILDMPDKKGNYLEASASCMFIYAMAKGVRMGYLPARFMTPANAAWNGIQKEFVESKDSGINLLKTIGGAGLGGNPYRDGTFNYYVNEKIVTNDPKGVGSVHSRRSRNGKHGQSTVWARPFCLTTISITSSKKTTPVVAGAK